MPAGVLMAKLGVVDTMTPKLKKARKALTGLATITAAGWAPKLIDGIGRATTAFIDFQGALNQVKAVSGATDKQMLLMKEQAKDLGSTTMFSAKQAAEAQSFLAMAGLEVEQVLAAMPGTLNLAAAGNLDLGQAANVATNIMSGMGLQVSDLGEVTDVMAATAASANTDVAQLGEAMKYAASVSNAAGLDIQTTSAAIGVLSNRGIQGSMAGTALRTSLAQLAQKGKKAGGTITELNGRVLEHAIHITDAEGKMLPFTEVLENLGRAGLDLGDMMTLAGQEGGAALLNLVEGRDELQKLKSALDEAGGAAKRMADTQQEGLFGLKTQFVSAVDVMWTALGDRFEPAMASVITASTDAARAVIHWADNSNRAKQIVSGVTFVLQNMGTWLGTVKDILVIGGGAWLAYRTSLLLSQGAVLGYKAAKIGLMKLQAGYHIAMAGWTKAVAIYRAGTVLSTAKELLWAGAIKAKTAVLWLWNTALTVGTGGLNLIIPLVIAAGVAWYKWSDEIKRFLSQVWNRFLDTVETGLPLLSKIGNALGFELPANLDKYRIAIRMTNEEAAQVGPLAGKTAEEIAAMGDQAVDTGEDLVDLTGEAGDLAGTLSGLGSGAVSGSASDAAAALNETQEAAAQAAEEIRKSKVAYDEHIKKIAATRRVHLQLAEVLGIRPEAAQSVSTMTMEVKTLDERLEEARDSVAVLYADMERQEPFTEFLSNWNATFSPENIFKTMSRVFESGGTWTDGMKSVGAQAGAKFFTGMKDGTLSALPGMMGSIGGKISGLWAGVSSAVSAIPFAGPILAAFGPTILKGLGKLGKRVWKGIKRMFGGPSEAEVAARDFFESFRKTATSELSGVEEFSREVSALMSQGWDRRLAEASAGFTTWAQAAGVGYEEARSLYTQFQNAIKRGDVAEMQRIQQIVDGWKERGAAIEETTQAEAAARLEAIDDAASAYKGMADEADRAYASAVQAALDAGQSQEAAAAAGAAAWNRTYEKKKQLRIQEMAEEAAFAAALKAIKEGNAAGAAAAAQAAYNSTRETATMAFDAVQQAAEAAGLAVDDAAQRQQLVAEQARAAQNAMIDSVVGGYRQAMTASQQAGAEAEKAALKEGASKEEAARLGAAAAEHEYNKRKELRITQMAEEAAFSAALRAIKEGDIEGAAAAAAAAYNQTREAATQAFEAVEQAANAASDESIAATNREHEARKQAAEDAEKLAERQKKAEIEAEEAAAKEAKKSGDEQVKAAKDKHDKVVASAEDAAEKQVTAEKTKKDKIKTELDEMLTKAKTVHGEMTNSLTTEGEEAVTEMGRIKDAINRETDGIKRNVVITVTKKFIEGAKDKKPDGRASGGLVRAGQDYIVGEKGPELFRSGVSGHITPNHRLRGDSTRNVHLTIKVDERMVHGGSLPRALAAAVVRELPKELGSHGLT